ncbi:MAG: acyl-ACP--UDP-N-acetylglucosamine O-acyltransferase [Verrucomicrobiales bacterium]|nr:acyl-ACP--UDP-N-acetylglucosamine O-acyltransferase [Verrucomicrobiales bacterium]
MIHPTALVDPLATLADDVEIGPYAILEGPVVLASGCRVAAHAQLIGSVHVGPGSSIGRGAVIGEAPQDLSFDPATHSSVEIGKNCTLREHVTIHRGSKEGGVTRIGDDNLLMVGVHLAHDVQLGRSNVLANSALLAGHVVVGDNTFIGGGAVFHQFLRIGDGCVIQGNGSFSKDIPHYCRAQLYNRLVGLNTIGLRRQGFTAEDRAELKHLFNLLFQSGMNRGQALTAAQQQTWSARAQRLLDFVAAPSSKGVCAWRGSRSGAE